MKGAILAYFEILAVYNLAEKGKNMCDRGERRKKTFKKAQRQAKLFETVTGVSSKEYVGELGRFKKDKHLETRTDDDKTNSEWYGKKNYKHGDKKVFTSMDDQVKEYESISKPNPHEFLYAWD